jgi:hypothetical protein
MFKLVEEVHDGFDALPGLYGSKVRDTGKVTDWQSGLVQGTKVKTNISPSFEMKLKIVNRGYSMESTTELQR